MLRQAGICTECGIDISKNKRKMFMKRYFNKNFKISFYHIIALTLTAFWMGVLITALVLNTASKQSCQGPECSPRVVVEEKTPEPTTEAPEEAGKEVGSRHITRPTVKAESAHGSKKLIFLHGYVWNKYDTWKDFDWRKCPAGPKCQITTDRTRLVESDAVVYNSLKMPTTSTMNAHRSKQFRKVFLSGETPLKSSFVSEDYDNFFDHTVTYRSESDVRIPYWPNDGILPAMYRPKVISKTLDKEELLDLEDDVKSYFKKNDKEKFLSYTIKNCSQNVYANMFVRKLREEGNIDVYSTSDEPSCMKIIKETTKVPCSDLSSDDCVKHFEKYKFVIVADEMLCRDYTTADYWRAVMGWRAVPLVYGAGDYKRHLIPHSYIDTVGDEDYISPSFKKAYGSSQNAVDYYKSFHLWRHEDRVEKYYWQCELCKVLNTPKSTSKVRMSDFWSAKKHCGKSLNTHEKMRLQLVRTGVIR